MGRFSYIFAYLKPPNNVIFQVLYIISALLYVVNYDPDSGWINNIRKLFNKDDAKTVLENTKSFVAEIENIWNIESFKTINLDEIAASFGSVDKAAIDAGKSLQDGKIGINEFRSSALSGAEATKKLAASLKSMAANLAIMLLVTVVIKGLTYIIDEAVTTTEEYKEKLADLKSEYSEITSELTSLESELETVQSRMDELEALGSLTFTEQEEYDNLVKQNNELQRSIDLLNLQKQQKSQELASTFVDTLNDAPFLAGHSTIF